MKLSPIHHFLLGLSICTIIFLICNTIVEYIFNKEFALRNSNLDPKSNLEKIHAFAAHKYYSIALQSYLSVKDERLVDQNGTPVDLQNIKTKDCALIVHGFGCCPNHYLNLIDFVAEKYHLDTYATLLPGHGRPVSRKGLKSLSKQSLSQSLLKDIEYLVGLGYVNLYCIGISIGGACLFELSSAQALKKYNNRIKLITAVPGINVELPYPYVLSLHIHQIAVPAYNSFQKLLSVTRSIPVPVTNEKFRLPMCLLTKDSVNNCVEMSNNVAKKLTDKEAVQNNFVAMVSKSDNLINYDNAVKLLQVQERNQGILTLEKCGHNFFYSNKPEKIAEWQNSIQVAFSLLQNNSRDVQA